MLILCPFAGGHFVGSYVMEFADVEHAQSYKAGLKAKFEGFGMSAGGAADFEKEVKDIQEVKSCQGQYNCAGWSSAHPPKLGCTLEDLVAAHDHFDISNGQISEAFLRRYTDTDQYQECYKKYKDATGSSSANEQVFIKVRTVMTDIHHSY